MKKYDKLVRDKIPEIIQKNGREAIFYVADTEEYWQKLKEKLQEEVKEFLADETIEEIADIYEVLEAICRYKKLNKKKIDSIKNKKAKERGVFKKRIILKKA